MMLDYDLKIQQTEGKMFIISGDLDYDDALLFIGIGSQDRL